MNNSPNLNCDNSDIYTVDKFEYGNRALTYPIGLISADEAMFAGILASGTTSNYLCTNQLYWTMSPYDFRDNKAFVFSVNSSGNLGPRSSVTNMWGVRPVINLKANVSLTGTGSTSDPFKVVGAS